MSIWENRGAQNVPNQISSIEIVFCCMKVGFAIITCPHILFMYFLLLKTSLPFWITFALCSCMHLLFKFDIFPYGFKSFSCSLEDRTYMHNYDCTMWFAYVSRNRSKRAVVYNLCM
jgi:hypothetical protein